MTQPAEVTLRGHRIAFRTNQQNRKIGTVTEDKGRYVITGSGFKVYRDRILAEVPPARPKNWRRGRG